MEEIVKGSLQQVAKQNNTSIAETFIGADAIVLVDISLSMSGLMDDGFTTKWTMAKNELSRLQEKLPGKIALISFSEWANFIPSGFLPSCETSTDMTRALRFIKPADSIRDMKFFIISDGVPDDRISALELGRKFKNKLNTIFIGSEADSSGQLFLRELASVSGGQYDLKPDLLFENLITTKLLEVSNG